MVASPAWIEVTVGAARVSVAVGTAVEPYVEVTEHPVVIPAVVVVIVIAVRRVVGIIGVVDAGSQKDGANQAEQGRQ